MKKTITTILLGLLFTPVLSNRAEAIIYDVNFSVNDGATTGTIIGTMSTVPGNNLNGLGDYVSGDFTLGDYQLELTLGSKTFTAINSNSNLLIDKLEIGDLTANNTGLWLDFRNPVDAQDLFEIIGQSSAGGLGFVSYYSGLDVNYESVMTVGAPPNRTGIIDSREINFPLGTAVSSASVPFEFSPTLGLLLMSVWGLFWRWQKSFVATKSND